MPKETDGIKVLLGEPKKAILRLSGPMIAGMMLQSLYNLVDGIWVAGLGSSALAAVGLFFPVFMIIIALGAGIGVGGSSAISRYIGAKDKAGADLAAVHALILGISIALLISVPSLPFLREMFEAIGARMHVLDMVTAYSRVLIGGAVITVFSNIAGAILRGEGDTKRAMYAMATGSILNIILDPIFIYLLHMGVVGAAWATLVSITLSSGLLGWWLFIKRNTYVRLRFHGFRFDRRIIGRILRVGLPSSFAQMSMSIAIFTLNAMIIRIGGPDGIAIYTSAWRILMLGVIPLLGIAVGVTAVTAAAFGARDLQKLKTGYLFGVKVGVLAEVIVVLLFIVFAHPLAFLFSYSKGANHIAGPLAKTLRILALFLPTVPLGMLTAAMFNGVGMGERALAVMIFRTIILQVLFAYLMGIVFHYGLYGMWWGIVTGNITASVLAFLWGGLTIKGLAQKLQQGHESA